jgi:hypothetical protein
LIIQNALAAGALLCRPIAVTGWPAMVAAGQAALTAPETR